MVKEYKQFQLKFSLEDHAKILKAKRLLQDSNPTIVIGWAELMMFGSELVEKELTKQN